MRRRERFTCGRSGFSVILTVFCGLCMFFIIGCGNSGLVVENEHAQGLATFSDYFLKFSEGRIFEERGMVVLNIAKADALSSGAVTVYDEHGNSISRNPISPGTPYIDIELSSVGSYSITASVRYVDGIAAERTVTAAVVDSALPAFEREASAFGLWHVSGDIKLVGTAGARWTRRMSTIKDYREGLDGKPIPMEFNKNPIDKSFEWIGTLAWGLPSYLTGMEPAKGVLYPPKDWDRFRELIERFAQDLPEFPPYFEAYNEPEAHWKGTDEELVKFISVIAQGIKAVHPETVVLGPTMYSIRMPYFKRLVELGVLDHLDGISMHAYVYGTKPEDEFIGRVVELKEYLASIGKGWMPVFLTEFGWTTGVGTWQEPVDELTQAQYLSRSLTLLTTEDIDCFIYFCLLYATAPNDGEAGFSILHQDKSPKPAYAAYANAARRLSGVTGKGRWLRVSPSGNIVLFRKGGATVAVVWDTNDASSFIVGLKPHDAVDMMGMPIAQELGGFALNGSPIFLTLGDTSLFNMGVSSPISLRSGERAFVSVVDLVCDAFSIRDGVLDVARDAPAGRYMILGLASGGWQVLPLEVLTNKN